MDTHFNMSKFTNKQRIEIYKKRKPGKQYQTYPENILLVDVMSGTNPFTEYLWLYYFKRK